MSEPASSARGDQAPARTLYWNEEGDLRERHPDGSDTPGGIVLDGAGPVTRAELLDAIEDEGEPLPTPPPPNMGGEGNPEYNGPHYDSVLGLETRFAPYDVLREPLPGAAVHFAGDAACAGPIDLHREGDLDGETDTRRSDGEEPDGDRERD